MKNNLCKCGCGLSVRLSKNRYLTGHNQRGISRPEHERKKISDTMRKRWLSPEAKKIWNKTYIGRPHSEETRKKISEQRRGFGNGMYGKHPSPESIKKRILARAGYRHSEETKIKMSIAAKGRVISERQKKKISRTLRIYFRDHENSFCGRNHSKESKEKMRIANTGRFRGENGPNWQGGLSSLPYSKEWTSWLIKEIRIRDNFKCQNPRCKDFYRILDVHHIDYNKKNQDRRNLITLCKKCHGKTQKKREFWKDYYRKIMIKRFSTCRFTRRPASPYRSEEHGQRLDSGCSKYS